MNLRNKLRNLGAAQQNVRAEMAGHITNNWIKTENQRRLTEKGGNEDSEDPIGFLLNQLPATGPVSSNEIQRKFTRAYTGNETSKYKNLEGDMKPWEDPNDPDYKILNANAARFHNLSQLDTEGEDSKNKPEEEYGPRTARLGPAQSSADKTWEDYMPIDNVATLFHQKGLQQMVEPSSSGFQEFADKKIGLNTTKKDIFRSASNNYGSNTDSILSDENNFRNGKLKRKARLAIEKNQTKQRSLRQAHDNLPKY